MLQEVCDKLMVLPEVCHKLVLQMKVLMLLCLEMQHMIDDEGWLLYRVSMHGKLQLHF